MIFRSLAKFCTQQGIPKKFIDAMKFDIPKTAEDRYMNIKALTNNVLDRLSEEDLLDFVKDFSSIRDRNITCVNTLKVSIFKLFNEYKILDLVPLCLKVDISEVDADIFEDEFQRVRDDYKSDYKYFLTHRQDFFRPISKSLTDIIPYKRKYFLTQQQKRSNFQLTKFEEQIDEQLISIVKSYNAQNLNEESLALDERLQICKQERIIKNKIFKTQKLRDQQSSLIFKQKNIQETPLVKTNQVGCFGLPYKLDDAFKEEFELYIREQIGAFKEIKYFEYSGFRTIRMEETNSFLNNENLKQAVNIINRIQRTKNRKLNKSYAIIDFGDENVKQKGLAQDVRIFGLKFKDMLFKMDDMDYKHVLYVNNVNKYKTARQLLEFLENKLNCKLEITDDRQYIQNRMITIICSSYQETMRIYELLNKQTFHKYQLSVFHYPEGLRYVGPLIQETLLVNDALSKLFELQNAIRFREQEEEYLYQDSIIDIPIHPQQIEYLTEDIGDEVQEEQMNISLLDLIWDDECIYY